LDSAADKLLDSLAELLLLGSEVGLADPLADALELWAKVAISLTDPICDAVSRCVV
jgi:hypothetical protein